MEEGIRKVFLKKLFLNWDLKDEFKLIILGVDKNGFYIERRFCDRRMYRVYLERIAKWKKVMLLVYREWDGYWAYILGLD